MRAAPSIALATSILLAACGSAEPQPDPTEGLDAAADSGSLEEVAPPADVASPADMGPEEVGEEDTGASVEPRPPPSYPLDEVLRVNDLQARGTHNSTHVEPPENVVPDWAYTHAPLDVQLAEQGVRQIELDIHRAPDGGFEVFHVPVLDELSTCDRLTECLELTLEWSDANPGHHLLAILIEPKDELDTLPIDDYQAVDAALLSVWPRPRVLTPDDVRGEHPSLRAALDADGWPTLGATRDRVMFVMLDSGAHRDGYLDTFPNLEGAVIFARGGAGEPWSAVIETGDPLAIQEMAAAGYLVRTSANDAESAEAKREAGAHWISTDFPAPVDPDGFWLELPGGAPSRCNPVVAPPGCKPQDVEALGTWAPPAR